MPVRRLRQILSSLTLILATLAIVFFLQQLQKQKSQRQIAAEITRLCQLPDLPDSLTIRHASIDHSEQRSYADVILALSGPPKALDEWLETPSLPSGFPSQQKKIASEGPLPQRR